MAASARSRGVVLKTETRVEQILIRGGEVRGVVTGRGEEIEASIVAACHPRTTVLDLIEEGEADWQELRRKMARKSMKGKAFTLVLALDARPRWIGERGEEEAAALGRIDIQLQRGAKPDFYVRFQGPGRVGPFAGAGVRCRRAVHGWTRRRKTTVAQTLMRGLATA